MSKKLSSFRHVPNMITCLNLFCGCMSIVCSSFYYPLYGAAYFIFAAAVFDFFDGFAARRLKAYSAIGKELDSLADMVSFGVAPALIMFNLILLSIDFDSYLHPFDMLVASSAFLIAIFSALRLAKFNTDTRQADSFIGLPTPANALFICSLVFIQSVNNQFSLFVGNMFFLLTITIVFSYLLVAELPLFSLKFKSFDWKNNQIRYIFVALSAFILIFLHWTGLAVVIPIYIILSIFTNLLCNRKVST